MTQHRDNAQAISDMAGIEDGGRTTEAFTRFFHRGSRVGWNALTQDDFAMIEDAFADSMGRPRRKRKNNLVWKIGFWWHWHVTSPIIYPASEVFTNVLKKIYWHAWKKRHGGKVLAPYRGDPGETFIKYIAWTEWTEQRRQLNANLPNLPIRYRIAARLGRLYGGWVWCCPDCDFDFGQPDDTMQTEIDADAALKNHARVTHDGIIPGACGVAQIFWI